MSAPKNPRKALENREGGTSMGTRRNGLGGDWYFRGRWDPPYPKTELSGDELSATRARDKGRGEELHLSKLKACFFSDKEVSLENSTKRPRKQGETSHRR